MPTYVYNIIGTDEKLEVRQSINDDALTEINGYPVQRIPQSPHIIIDFSKPKSVATLAHKNTEKKIAKGELVPQKKKEIPWWRPNKKKPIDITGKSKTQVEKYIIEGKNL